MPAKEASVEEILQRLHRLPQQAKEDLLKILQDPSYLTVELLLALRQFPLQVRIKHGLNAGPKLQ